MTSEYVPRAFSRFGHVFKAVAVTCSRLHLKLLCPTGKELNQEKNKELDATHKEHQRQIQILVESNKKEIDVSAETLA